MSISISSQICCVQLYRNFLHLTKKLDLDIQAACLELWATLYDGRADTNANFRVVKTKGKDCKKVDEHHGAQLLLINALIISLRDLLPPPGQNPGAQTNPG